MNKDGIPPNQLYGSTIHAVPEDSLMRIANSDTYFSSAILDIRYEPVVITVPEIKDRYFSIQMLDMFTNSLDYISPASMPDEASGNFLIARSDWEGTVPDNINKVIKSSGTLLFTIFRTQFFNHEDEKAEELVLQYEIQPLSRFAGTLAPSAERFVWEIPPCDGKICDIEPFFNTFNYMIQYQILNDEEKDYMQKFAAINIVPGKQFSKADFSPELWSALESGVREARALLDVHTSIIEDTYNNWDCLPKNIGRWGDNYLPRAIVTWKYPYIDAPEEVIYFTSHHDSDENNLNGAYSYTITFPKESFPDASFFWSLTMYNEADLLVKNEINRYCINSSRQPLKSEKDGSTIIYIQRNNPGEEKESNWLPAPEHYFHLIFRIYGPDEKVLSGGYLLPDIKKVH